MELTTTIVRACFGPFFIFVRINYRICQELKKIGLTPLLLSDNSEERINCFNRNINCQYIANANKPESKNYYVALKKLKLSKEQVVCIGDQIFRDIYGANRVGIPNILVKYMRYSDHEKIGIRRNLEKIILFLYSCLTRYQHRLGNIEKEECN